MRTCCLARGYAIGWTETLHGYKSSGQSWRRFCVFCSRQDANTGASSGERTLGSGDLGTADLDRGVCQTINTQQGDVTECGCPPPSWR